MTAVLPLGNSIWLLVIIGILCLILFVWMLVMTYKWDMDDTVKSLDDDSKHPRQPSNIRVIGTRPFDWDKLPRPYDREEDE